MRIAPPNTQQQKASFNESVKGEKVTSTRIVVLLGAALLIIYSFMDYFGLPKEALYINYPLRGLDLLILAATFALTFKPIFAEQYNKILMFNYFCTGITISIGVLISQPGEYIYDIYFAGIMILIITTFSWTYLPVKHSILISVVFSAIYVMIKVFVHKDIEGSRFLTLMSHLFFLAGAGIIALIAQYIRDNLIYKNLKLQKRLKAIAASKTKEAEIQAKLANMDELTGIPNRRYIRDCLRKALIEVEQSQNLLTLLFIDLNGFKRINDTYGHDSGDKVLEITAQRLQHTIREGDYLARLGGDEFLIGFKTNQFSAKLVGTLCSKLRKNIAAPIAFNGHKLQVGTSIGIASYPKDGKNFEELIKVADRHMYLDKEECKRMKTTASNQTSA